MNVHVNKIKSNISLRVIYLSMGKPVAVASNVFTNKEKNVSIEITPGDIEMATVSRATPSLSRAVTSF